MFDKPWNAKIFNQRKNISKFGTIPISRELFHISLKHNNKVVNLKLAYVINVTERTYSTKHLELRIPRYIGYFLVPVFIFYHIIPIPDISKAIFKFILSTNVRKYIIIFL